MTVDTSLIVESPKFMAARQAPAPIVRRKMRQRTPRFELQRNLAHEGTNAEEPLPAMTDQSV